jgi:hypothetical protein
MVEKQWIGCHCHDGWTLPQFWLKNQNISELNFPQTSAPKPCYCKTYGSWILISTIQNNPLGVSSKLGWLRSNGLAVMGWTLPQFWLKNQNICPAAEFSTDTAQLPNQTAARLTAHGS